MDINNNKEKDPKVSCCISTFFPEQTIKKRIMAVLPAVILLEIEDQNKSVYDSGQNSQLEDMVHVH